MKFLTTALIIMLAVASSYGQDFAPLKRSVMSWQELFYSHYNTNAFVSTNVAKVSSIVLLIRDFSLRGSWIVVRESAQVSTNMPTATYAEGGPQRVLVSSEAVDFLCMAPAETNIQNIVGLAAYSYANRPPKIIPIGHPF